MAAAESPQLGSRHRKHTLVSILRLEGGSRGTREAPSWGQGWGAGAQASLCEGRTLVPGGPHPQTWSSESRGQKVFVQSPHPKVGVGAHFQAWGAAGALCRTEARSGRRRKE